MIFHALDLLFLLGGFPRASVMVDSEAADVIRIDRGKLSSVLASDVRIASRFCRFRFFCLRLIF